MILLRHGQSHFNVHFAATRQDPGIIDPGLTEAGRRQAAEAAAALKGLGLRRVLASPYRRTLETAEIVAGRLGLSVLVEPVIRERCYFTCDIGSPRSDLGERWPHFDFADLGERWWPEPEETEAEVALRCGDFRTAAAALDDWQLLLVVTHWGFIRGLTGHEVGNGALLRFDPHRQTTEPVVPPGGS